MENRKETAYRFSYCLFAYLYKKVKFEVKLPLDTDYIVPTTSLFSNEIGDCILKIRTIFKPYLENVISNDFPRIRSEENLFECAKWYSETLISLESFTFLKLMTLCYLLMEIVVYYFRKDCFCFTSSAPTCLSEILLSSQVFVHCEPLSLLFTELKNFSNGILQNTNIYSNNLPSILAQEAKDLENNFMFLFSNNSPENSDDTSAIASRCLLQSKEKCKIPQFEFDALTKLDGFQILNIENSGSISGSEDISKSVDFQPAELMVVTQPLKRKEKNCDRENVMKSKEIKLSIPSSQLFHNNDSPSILSPLKPSCLKSHPKLSIESNKSSEESNQEEYDFDFSTCFEPFDYDYDNVDEFNPSDSYQSEFHAKYLKEYNFNLSENKSNSCNSFTNLCSYCNYCCMDVLSDFIDDFKETNYESD